MESVLIRNLKKQLSECELLGAETERLTKLDQDLEGQEKALSGESLADEESFETIATKRALIPRKLQRIAARLSELEPQLAETALQAGVELAGTVCRLREQIESVLTATFRGALSPFLEEEKMARMVPDLVRSATLVTEADNIESLGRSTFSFAADAAARRVLRGWAELAAFETKVRGSLLSDATTSSPALEVK